MSPLPRGPYGVILADPPWAYRTYSGLTMPHRTADAPYPVMTAAELQAMPVAASAARDCALFMWVSGADLPAALKLGRAWGFRFTTDAFVWIKTDKAGRPRMSFGKWTRNETEQCWLFTRGRPSPLPGHGGVRQTIFAPRRENSRKPDEQYERIEALCPGPYLELFSRTSARGWDAWGHDAGRFQAAPTPEPHNSDPERRAA